MFTLACALLALADASSSVLLTTLCYILFLLLSISIIFPQASQCVFHPQYPVPFPLLFIPHFFFFLLVLPPPPPSPYLKNLQCWRSVCFNPALQYKYSPVVQPKSRTAPLLPCCVSFSSSCRLSSFPLLSFTVIRGDLNTGLRSEREDEAQELSIWWSVCTVWAFLCLYLNRAVFNSRNCGGKYFWGVKVSEIGVCLRADTLLHQFKMF